MAEIQKKLEILSNIQTILLYEAMYIIYKIKIAYKISLYNNDQIKIKNNDQNNPRNGDNQIRNRLTLEDP